MNEEQYLKERLEDQIEWYGNKSQWNQKWFKRLKQAELIMATMIPVIISFGVEYLAGKIVIALLGGLIAISNGLHGLYNFHENWIEYRGVSETLKHEKFLYITKTGAYFGINNPFELLVERVESIISHENINWAQINRSPRSASSLNTKG